MGFFDNVKNAMRGTTTPHAPVEPGSPKDPGGPGDPVDPPEPEVVPSSTPDGPQTIPPIETDVQDSNPNSGGPQRLEGDMGISSERTGPLGSHGSATESTDGQMETYPEGDADRS